MIAAVFVGGAVICGGVLVMGAVFTLGYLAGGRARAVN